MAEVVIERQFVIPTVTCMWGLVNVVRQAVQQKCFKCCGSFIKKNNVREFAVTVKRVRVRE